MNTPFNKRIIMLQALSNRPATGSKRSLNAAVQRNRCYTHQNPLKTLDFLRQIVQNSINKEIDSIVQHYMQKFFAPAMLNIRRNGFDVTDEQIHLICRRMLEEAKKMYCVSMPSAQESELFECSDDRASFPRIINKHISGVKRGKRKDTGGESDTESEVSQASSNASSVPKKKARKEPFGTNSNVEDSTDVQLKDADIRHKYVEKWNPDRLTKDTIFVFGSKANSALGFGSKLGRIYTKHPEIFRYSTNLEDMQHVYETTQKTVRFGRRAIFLILDDVLELCQRPEYKCNPAVHPEDLKGFKISDSLLFKMKLKTKKLYNDICRKHELPLKHDENDLNQDDSFTTEEASDKE